MANVAKRPNGKYRARYRDPAGREHARHFDKKRDAERWLTSIGADLARGEYVDPRGGRTTFRERYEFWFATTVNLRESTRARDDSYGRNLILPAFEHRRLSSIDHDTIQRWMAELGAQGYAPATVVKAHQILCKVFRSAVRARLIPTNPCDESVLPKIEREEQLFLSAEEVAHLAETIDPHFRVMVLFAAYTGLRLGELAGLRRRGSTSRRPRSPSRRSASRYAAAPPSVRRRRRRAGEACRSPTTSSRSSPSTSLG